MTYKLEFVRDALKEWKPMDAPEIASARGIDFGCCCDKT